MDREFSSLKREVAEIRGRNPQLKPDEAFIVWFMRGFLTDDEQSSIASLVGGTGDKSVDAVYIDDATKVICLIQGKYQAGAKPKAVPRSEVIALANTGRCLLEDSATPLRSLLEKCAPNAADALSRSREAIHRKGYRLNLYFVTSGSVTPTAKEDAASLIEDWVHSSLDVHTRRSLLDLMQDYIEGAAPPIPTVAIPFTKEQSFGRYDPGTRVNCCTFTARGPDIGRLFREYGVRLFARNIRGYLGNTSINDSMRATITTETEYFWHFNNGVTIICDDAKMSDLGREHVIRVSNPQVINGQQTTRVLAENPKDGTEVLVRVIAVPREGGMYSRLVGSIVAAANSQNAISTSDLRSNDLQQVRLERDLAKLRYAYLRKRMSKAEVRRRYGKTFVSRIDKAEMAIAVASCTMDPALLRKGKENLFAKDTYTRLFTNRRSAFDYLAFYWMHRLVSARSRSDPTRGYARYLVTNFCWSLCSRHIGDGTRQRLFVEACEGLPRNLKGLPVSQFPRELRPLLGLADLAFSNSVRFFTANRHSDGRTIDASGFFKNISGLDHQFPRFVLSRHRGRYRRAVQLASLLGARLARAS
jgi:hypothetical protein